LSKPALAFSGKVYCIGRKKSMEKESPQEFRIRSSEGE